MGLGVGVGVIVGVAVVVGEGVVCAAVVVVSDPPPQAPNKRETMISKARKINDLCIILFHLII